MHSGGASGNRDICPVIHEYRNPDRPNELARHSHEVSGRDIFEPELNACCAAVNRCRRTSDQTALSIANVVSDRDESENGRVDQDIRVIMDKRLCALRGATTVNADSPAQIADATAELLTELMSRNGLDASDVISAIFTVTPDIVSDFPARAARDLGWEEVSLLCTTEIAVTGALGHCIRVLIHAESARDRSLIRHVYLRGAKSLRPDLISE